MSHNLKPLQDCPCGVEACEAYGMLRVKTGHVRGCKCPRCLAGRNSKKGKALHRQVARQLGAATPGRGSSSHEESWVHAWRVEVKTGAQAGPVTTRWRASRDQSEASRAFGDSRPFVAIFTTGAKGDPTLAVLELETLQRIADLETMKASLQCNHD